MADSGLQQMIEVAGVGLALGGAFFVTSTTVIPLLKVEKREQLVSWLLGEQGDTYASSFNAMFESLFGASHLSWKCLRRSVIMSFASVMAIYVFLGPLLNLLDTRAGGALPFWQILAFGAVVNLIPDYLSLWETRVVLKLFERLKSTSLQFLILLFDFFLSACIILGSLSAFLWLTGGVNGGVKTCHRGGVKVCHWVSRLGA